MRINIIDSDSYFEKENENCNWEFVSGQQNSAMFLKEYKMTEEVGSALDFIFSAANPEEEDKIEYDFDRDREDNEEEELTILDWLGW